MASTEQYLISSFVALEGAHTYSAFLPSIFTIRHFGTSDTAKQDFYEGIFIASLYVLVLSVVTAKLIGDSLPLFFGLLTIVLMTAVYLHAINTVHGGRDAKA